MSDDQKTDASDVLIKLIGSITSLLKNKRTLVFLGVLVALWTFNEGWWDIPLLRSLVTEAIRAVQGIMPEVTP